jgi:fructokinase
LPAGTGQSRVDTSTAGRAGIIVAMTIVVAGEALFDLVLREDGSLGAHPGGGPFNAARTIARLGAPVTFLGGISTDAFGRRLAAMLAEDGVDHPRELVTDAPTTLAVAELSAAGSAEYRFYTEGTAAATEVPAAALPSAVDAVLVGTLGLVIEPLASSIERLIEATEAPVLLDANVRPSAIADEAAYRARLTRVVDRAQWLKASDDDLAWIAPGTDPVDAARALGAPTTLITRGARGATVVTADAAVDIPAPPVDVVDTIGAGDAFAGAFLTRRAEGAEQAAAFAAEVAADTCTRPGADPPRR